MLYGLILLFGFLYIITEQVFAVKGCQQVWGTLFLGTLKNFLPESFYARQQRVKYFWRRTRKLTDS
jgi:hypothetical protein